MADRSPRKRGAVLRPVEQRTGILRQFAAVFAITGERTWWSTASASWCDSACTGIALGYEDLNDHDQLRQDPLLALPCPGKRAVEGETGGAAGPGKAGAGRALETGWN